MNTEDSPTAFSLDALLGLQPQAEEQPEAEEWRSPTQAPSVDLLSMLGLVPEEDDACVDGGDAAAGAVDDVDAADAAAGSVDLRALLGLGEVDPVEKPAVVKPAEKPAAFEIFAAPAVPAAPRAPEVPAPVAPTVRSRFADAPAFRQPEKDPAIPVTSAVRYLAGESRPLGLPERAQLQDAPGATAEKAADRPQPEESAKSAQPAQPSKPAKPTQPAKPASAPQVVRPAQPAKPTPQPKPKPKPRPQPAKQQRASVVVPGDPAESAASPAASAAPAVAKPQPSSAPKASAAVEPPSRPAASPQNPLRPDRAGQPAKRSNGVWYLVSACLFALALACTCYAVYAASHGEAPASPASIVTSESPETTEQRYRYSVQGSDGAVRSVTETARFDIDGFVAESTVSFEAQNESEALSFLEDAKAQFGDAWVSGVIEDGKAVFTVTHADKLDRDAYTALLKATTTDCETVQ